jgi:hypothetical protein
MALQRPLELTPFIGHLLQLAGGKFSVPGSSAICPPKVDEPASFLIERKRLSLLTVFIFYCLRNHQSRAKNSRPALPRTQERTRRKICFSHAKTHACFERVAGMVPLPWQLVSFSAESLRRKTRLPLHRDQSYRLLPQLKYR